MPSQKVSAPKSTTLPTSSADSPQFVYSRYRTAAPPITDTPML